MPLMPLPGNRNSRNCLTVRSEAWRRLEIIYQIDAPDFARKVISCEYESKHFAKRPHAHLMAGARGVIKHP